MKQFEIEDSQSTKTSFNKEQFQILPSQGQYYGKHKPFFFIKNVPYFTIGPDWNFSIGLMSFFVMIGFGSFWAVFKGGNIYQYWISISINLLLFISYTYTALRNPGLCIQKDIDEEDYIEAQNKDEFCGVCKVYKKENRVHCDDCQICIDEYDHHCPWTSKCIGKNNFIPFNIFLFAVIVFFVGNFVLAVLSLTDQQLRRSGRQGMY